MSAIPNFLTRYVREFDYYREAAQLCARRCQLALAASGIRAIVTARAKDPVALKQKLDKRNSTKKYRTIDHIYTDIVDMAGVRIALYCPGDINEIRRIIESSFVVVRAKEFPDNATNLGIQYARAFPGYKAVHFHVRMKLETLTEEQQRYANSLIEIQVASVLMHAWAEVEHDIAYKPATGEVSVEELMILDQINGMVISAEIALHTLQKALNQRVSQPDQPFQSHYDVASYIYMIVRPMVQSGGKEPLMGRADVLLRFLEFADLNSPKHLQPFICELDLDEDARSLVDQIADRILSTEERFYDLFEQARRESGSRNPYESFDGDRGSNDAVIGEFLAKWFHFETSMRAINLTEFIPKGHARPSLLSLRYMLNALKRLKILDDIDVSQAEWVRNVRAELVHQNQSPSRAALVEAGGILDRITEKIQDVSTSSNCPRPGSVDGGEPS